MMLKLGLIRNILWEIQVGLRLRISLVFNEIDTFDRTVLKLGGRGSSLREANPE